MLAFSGPELIKVRLWILYKYIEFKILIQHNCAALNSVGGRFLRFLWGLEWAISYGCKVKEVQVTLIYFSTTCICIGMSHCSHQYVQFLRTQENKDIFLESISKTSSGSTILWVLIYWWTDVVKKDLKEWI